MVHDIWELDGAPTVISAAPRQVVTVTPTAPQLNFWSLAIIILVIWLVVKEL